MQRMLNSVAKAALAGLAVLTIMAVTQTGEVKAQEGKSLYLTKGCVACHGADGKAPIQPAYAKLVGQNSEYIVVQLKAFKAMQRKSGQSALMWGMAAQLSEDDMKKIATYLQGVK